MTTVAKLVAWLAGAGMPDGDLCRQGCGRVAIAGDGAAVCAPCILRLADLAGHPDRFETQVLADRAVAHGDVVELATIEVGSHARVTWMGIAVCQHRALAWRWSDAWPSDDRTLEDILETAALERLWARSPRAAA